MPTENLKYVLTVDNKDFKKKMNESRTVTEKSSKGIISSFGNIAGAAKTFIGAAVVVSIGKAVASMITMAEESRVVERSFDQLTKSVGQNSTRILQAMQKGIGGTVSQLDLMKQANSAILLGIPVTAQKMEQMAETALRLGRAVGRTGKESMGDLITGIGRMSPLILDNLGITIKAEEAFRGLGDGATDAEKRLAFFNAVMIKANEKSKQLGDIAPSTGEKLSALGAKWDDLAGTLGKVFIPVANDVLGVLQAILGTAEAIGGLGDFLNMPEGHGEGKVGVGVTSFKARSALSPAALAAAKASDEGLETSFLIQNAASRLGHVEAMPSRGGINQTTPFETGFGRPRERSMPMNMEVSRAEVLASVGSSKSVQAGMRDPIDIDTSNIDKALEETFGEKAPKEISDGMNMALTNIGAGLDALGIKGGAVLSGIGQARQGLSGLGVGGLGGSTNKLLKGIGDAAGVLAGGVAIFQGLKGLFGGPSFAEKIKSESDVEVRQRIKDLQDRRAESWNFRGSHQRIDKQIETAENELEARREQQEVEGSATSTNITTLTDASGRAMVSNLQTILIELRSGHLNTIAANTTMMSATLATLNPAGQATAVVRDAQAQGN